MPIPLTLRLWHHSALRGHRGSEVLLLPRHPHPGAPGADIWRPGTAVMPSMPHSPYRPLTEHLIAFHPPQ